MAEINEQQLKEKKKKVNWLQLSDDLISQIGVKLMNHNVDFIRFGSVCRSWQSIYGGILHRNPTLPPQLPLLMISSAANGDDPTLLSFYSLSERKLLSNYKAELPQNNVCRGSSHGWIFVMDTVTFDIHLRNPFLSDNSKNKIQLPPLPRSGERLVKGVLSDNPTLNPNFIVLAIFGTRFKLAFFKPCNESWTLLSDRPYFDVTFHKDQFYAFATSTETFVCDLIHEDHNLHSVAPVFGLDLSTEVQYIVGCSEDLLLVQAVDNRISNLICEFEVFKLDENGRKWVTVEDLQGRVLFLGGNASMSLSAAHLPGCRLNSIYFTEDYFQWYETTSPKESDDDETLSPEESDNAENLPTEDSDYSLPSEEKCYDIGVFNMEDSRIVRFYPMKPNKNYYSSAYPIWIQPSAIWIQPTLQRRVT